jgi:hypothetical protein
MDLPETAGELFSSQSYDDQDLFLRTVRRLVNADAATQKPLAGVSGVALTKGERSVLKAWLGYPQLRPRAAFIRGAAEEGEEEEVGGSPLSSQDHRQHFQTILSLWDQRDFHDVCPRRAAANHHSSSSSSGNKKK